MSTVATPADSRRSPPAAQRNGGERPGLRNIRNLDPRLACYGCGGTVAGGWRGHIGPPLRGARPIRWSGDRRRRMLGRRRPWRRGAGQGAGIGGTPCRAGSVECRDHACAFRSLLRYGRVLAVRRLGPPELPYRSCRRGRGHPRRSGRRVRVRGQGRHGEPAPGGAAGAARAARPSNERGFSSVGDR